MIQLKFQTIMNKYLRILFLGAVLTSCNNSKSKSSISVQNETAENILIKKYDAVSNSDSAYQCSINYQETFITEKKLMLFKGRIYDIMKTDTNYLLKVLDEREDSPQNFLALITCDEQQLKKIYDDGTTTRGAFVIQVSKVTSSNPSIKMEEASDGDDNTYTYSHLSDDKHQMIFIFKAKLIDFHLDQIKK